MENYFSSWLAISTRSYKQNLKYITNFIIGKIAFKENFENIFQPIYQDYSKEGRIIGFVIRLARIIFGAILYCFYYALFNIIYLFWIMLPIVFLAFIFNGILEILGLIL